MPALARVRQFGGSPGVLLPKRSSPVAAGDIVRIRADRGRIIIERDPVVESIRSLLRPALPSILAAYLYGSYGREEWDPEESDIDVFILARTQGVEGALEKRLYDLELELGIPLSVLFYTPAEWGTIRDSSYWDRVRRGIPLYVSPEFRRRF